MSCSPWGCKELDMPELLNDNIHTHTHTHTQIYNIMVSLVAQMVKNLPVMWEGLIQYLGWEDPMEEGLATHSSILA